MQPQDKLAGRQWNNDLHVVFDLYRDNPQQMMFASEYQPSRLEHQPSRSQLQPSRLEHQPSRSEFQPSRFDHQPSRSDFQPSRTEFQPSRFEHQPSRSDYQPWRSDLQHSRSDFHPSRSVAGSQSVGSDSCSQYWAEIQRRQTHDSFLEGMLLRSLQAGAHFPYIHYILYNNQSPDKGSKVYPREDSCHALQDHSTCTHTGCYRELFTFVDHQTPLLPKRPQTCDSAYIISVFKAIGSLDALDKSWSYWSGADLIVETIPSILQLKRLTFHKIKPHGGGGGPSGESFAYILLCELGAALAHPNRALEFVSTLKDRQCGLSSLYTVQHYF